MELLLPYYQLLFARASFPPSIYSHLAQLARSPVAGLLHSLRPLIQAKIEAGQLRRTRVIRTLLQI